MPVNHFGPEALLAKSSGIAAKNSGKTTRDAWYAWSWLPVAESDKLELKISSLKGCGSKAYRRYTVLPFVNGMSTRVWDRLLSEYNFLSDSRQTNLWLLQNRKVVWSILLISIQKGVTLSGFDKLSYRALRPSDTQCAALWCRARKVASAQPLASVSPMGMGIQCFGHAIVPCYASVWTKDNRAGILVGQRKMEIVVRLLPNSRMCSFQSCQKVSLSRFPYER